MSRLLPWAALALTIVIWAGYLIVTRAAMNAHLGPVDVGLLRSLPAAILLSPFFFRHGLWPKGTQARDIFAIAICGGTVFIVFLAVGLSYAPVADSGIFTPSILPVWTAVLAFVFFRETRSGIQLVGLVLIVTGALAVGGWSAITEARPDAWKGHILFVAGSALWATYTLVFRVSALSALAATAVMAGWASLFFLAALPFTGLRLHEVPAPMLALQVTQGIASGLVANFTYLYAVRHLGTAIASASAALVPILAALGGLVFLGEHLTSAKLLGIAIVATGIVLASGVLRRAGEV